MPPDETESEKATDELEQACRKVDDELPAAAERHKMAASGVVDQALDLARVARRAQSSPHIMAVRPLKADEPDDDEPEELTAKFEALKPT